ncbi:MAG: DUF748 domain-containing protein [Verrucomicrobia bacterium]|nr:DUF748 domain-containing protein [Verrucomicrobiota bacterium]
MLFWCAGILIFYTITGFLIAPPIVRSVASAQLGKFLDREVVIAKVKLNPYSMSGTVEGFLIKDKGGKPFVSWDEVHANFQFWSLFTRTFVFSEISTSHPFVRVQVNPDYSLNFSDIIEKLAKLAAATPKSDKPSRPLALRIDVMKISAARLAATDLTTKTPFSKVIGPLELTLQNFATDPDNKNPYSFSGSTEEGERFSWSGHFFLDPVRLDGELAIENISLAKYAPIYQELVKFDVRGGTVDVRSSYLVEQGVVTNVARLTNAAVSVKGLQIAEHGAEDNAIEVAKFEISGVSADAFLRNVAVGSISTSNGRLAVRRNADASINLIELSKPNPDATNIAGSVQVVLQSLTNVVQLLMQSTNAFSGAIREINVQDYALRLEDLSTPRPVRVDLDQINVAIRNVSNLPGTNLTAEVALRWNTNGTIRTGSLVSLFPLKAEVKLALDKLEIRALDPYLDPFVNLLITQGSVGMDGVISLVMGTNHFPDVAFRGDVRVDDFATMDGVMTEDFVKCGRLRVTGIDATLHPLVIAVQEVALHDASARLVIGSVQSNNLFAVLKRDLSPPAETNAPAPTASTKKSGKLLPKIELPTNLIASAQAALPKITIGAVTFTNASLQYVDRSLQPGVSLAVAQVNGRIAGLSSEDLSRADLNISGKVDNTAPMDISGQINALGRKQFSDVKVNFRGIELIPTSPYSGKFLGYRLNKGKLSLDLHYTLAEGKLKGQNLVTVDQLTLGEKVESPDATRLPVRLGIAILKDRSGKIELDVPVEGSLDDPEFRLGRVITRAIVNVFTKIVTSPFAALGSVFGGKGEEVRLLEFAAGSAELQESSKGKLDAVAKGLFERPGLQLEIEGCVDAEADRLELRRQKLQKEFRTKKWMALRKSEQSRLTPDQVQLTAEESADYLKAAYATAFSPEAVAARAMKVGATNSTPATNIIAANQRPARAEAPVKGATALLRDARSDAPKLAATDMETQVLELIELSETDFAALAAARANRVKEYMIGAGKVEPERVFLAEKPEDGNPAKGSRVYLHLR